MKTLFFCRNMRFWMKHSENLWNFRRFRRVSNFANFWPWWVWSKKFKTVCSGRKNHVHNWKRGLSSKSSAIKHAFWTFEEAPFRALRSRKIPLVPLDNVCPPGGYCAWTQSQIRIVANFQISAWAPRAALRRADGAGNIPPSLAFLPEIFQDSNLRCVDHEKNCCSCWVFGNDRNQNSQSAPGKIFDDSILFNLTDAW